MSDGLIRQRRERRGRSVGSSWQKVSSINKLIHRVPISSEALRRLLCVEGIESSTGKSFVPRLHFPSRSANGGRPELDHRRWSRRPLRSTNLLPPPPFMPGIRFWRLPEWELEVQVHPFLRLNPHHPLHLPLSPLHPLPNSPPPRIMVPPTPTRTLTPRPSRA